MNSLQQIKESQGIYPWLMFGVCGTDRGGPTL